MGASPLRSLIIGYGGATLAAAALIAFGAGPVAAGVALWIGGAVAVLAQAALAARRAARRAGEEAGPLAAELARWEADRRDDAAPTRRRSGAVG